MTVRLVNTSGNQKRMMDMSEPCLDVDITISIPRSYIAPGVTDEDVSLRIMSILREEIEGNGIIVNLNALTEGIME